MAREKTSGVYFKVSEEDRKLIAQRMELAGIRNMSGYIRKMCIDGYTAAQRQRPERCPGPGPGNELCRESRENQRRRFGHSLRQSFKPGEITPELANKIGYDLAMSLTKGNHAFIVCTHVDKHHIHSHIVFNSTALDCTRKFRNFWRSSFANRKISDTLCLENGLSVIAKPKPSRGSYGTWLSEDKPPTVRGQLEGLIDAALGHGCKDFDCFLAALKAEGVEVKWGKHLAFKIPNGRRFIRCDSLGPDYSEAAILERISGKRIVAPKAKAPTSTKPNMLIDVQAKMRQANSPGFERWAKIFNLKEMAKTVMYLQKKGLADFGELEKTCDAAVQKCNDLSDRTKAASARMKDISELRKHTCGKQRLFSVDCVTPLLVHNIFTDIVRSSHNCKIRFFTAAPAVIRYPSLAIKGI